MKEFTKGSRSSVLLAILLGMLTFIITGIIMSIVAIPFLFLNKISENFHPLVIIANIFNLEGLGGWFVAVIIMMATFALLGDLGAAKISWFITRSRRLVRITFFSALIFQIVFVFITPSISKKEKEIMSAGIERENAYQQYATIGDVNVEALESFKFTSVVDGEWIESLLFKKLVFTVPVIVSYAGTYEIDIKYDSDSEFYANSNSATNIKKNLNVGAQLVKIELIAGRASNLGYELPESIHAKVLILMDYPLSKKELLDSLESEGITDQKTLQQYIEYEGFDNEASIDSTVNKFVGRKEIQF